MSDQPPHTLDPYLAASSVEEEAALVNSFFLPGGLLADDNEDDATTAGDADHCYYGLLDPITSTTASSSSSSLFPPPAPQRRPPHTTTRSNTTTSTRILPIILQNNENFLSGNKQSGRESTCDQEEGAFVRTSCIQSPPVLPASFAPVPPLEKNHACDPTNEEVTPTSTEIDSEPGPTLPEELLIQSTPENEKEIHATTTTTAPREQSTKCPLLERKPEAVENLEERHELPVHASTSSSIPCVMSEPQDDDDVSLHSTSLKANPEEQEWNSLSTMQDQGTATPPLLKASTTVHPDGSVSVLSASLHRSPSFEETKSASSPLTTTPKRSTPRHRKRKSKSPFGMRDYQKRSTTSSNTNITEHPQGSLSHYPSKTIQGESSYERWSPSCTLSVLLSVSWSVGQFMLEFWNVWTDALKPFLRTIVEIIRLGLLASLHTLFLAISHLDNLETSCTYLVLYFLPWACDELMYRVNLPFFAPHCISALVLYLWLYPSKSYSEQYVSSTVSGASLWLFRLGVLLIVVLEGFDQPNIYFMLLDGSDRLCWAFIIVAAKQQNLVSPIVWVSWSLQILIQFITTEELFAHFVLATVGFATFELIDQVKEKHVSQTPRKDRH